MAPEEPESDETKPASPVAQRAAPGPGLPKIFGIGLSRTGTTSLTAALDLLGFPAIHYPRQLSQIEAHAAATDITVSLVFKKLDRLYPGSAFIMTLRAPEPWLESCERLWRKNAAFFARNPMVMDIEHQFYGGTGFDRRLYTEARERHLAAVAEHFRDRPGDLLYLDLFETSAPWRTLCPFLQVAVPELPFPHRNRSAAIDRILLRLFETLNDAGQVARITQVSEDYLMKLSRDGKEIGETTPIMLDGGFEETLILQRACEALGSGRLAEILGLDPGRLEAQIGGAGQR